MENRGRVLSVDFSNAVGRTVKASPLTAIDYGQMLEIHGLPLPPSFECHFSKNGATAYKCIGTTTNGVGTVPFIDQYVSINSYDLITLPAGGTGITLSDVDSVEITPRWYEV